MHAPSRGIVRHQPKPLLATVLHRFHGWIERNIVARDPYDSVDQHPKTREKRSRVEGIILLALFTLSAIISVTGLILLWRIVAD
jgi:hypothetical protein